ncbi:MAG: endonuclease/exonuclease/phosphatase family protein [Inhella sp.]
MRTLISTLLLAAAAQTPWAQAAPLKVATWNLGWHLDRELAAQWRTACAAPFKLEGGRWKPAAAAGADTQPGWKLPWGRNAPIDWDIGALPPCDTYQHNRQAVAVTPEQDEQRRERLRTVLAEKLDADVIAFQEVSGAAAVRELVGEAYEVCSYEGHKVQRLAFAWKRKLGSGRCELDWRLALPQRAMADQVRPGLALSLQTGGKTLRFLTVHLKSSCVSALDANNPLFPAAAGEARGQLDGPNPHCQSLQEQVAPLEDWLERQSQGADGLVLLGDFNRNLGHEASEAAELPARSAGGSAAAPHGPEVKVRNLWRELNDGQPQALRLLSAECTGLPACALAKTRLLDRQEYGQLRATLGCRNPVGLDHIVVAGALKGDGAHKLALGAAGETRPNAQGQVELGLSDHCPLVAELEL